MVDTLGDLNPPNQFLLAPPEPSLTGISPKSIVQLEKPTTHPVDEAMPETPWSLLEKRVHLKAVEIEAKVAQLGESPEVKKAQLQRVRELTLLAQMQLNRTNTAQLEVEQRKTNRKKWFGENHAEVTDKQMDLFNFKIPPETKEDLLFLAKHVSAVDDMYSGTEVTEPHIEPIRTQLKNALIGCSLMVEDNFADIQRSLRIAYMFFDEDLFRVDPGMQSRAQLARSDAKLSLDDIDKSDAIAFIEEKLAEIDSLPFA